MRRVAAVALLLAPWVVRAQAGIPLISMPPSEVRSPVAVRNVWGIHELPDGRVLLNDALGRKLWLFEANLLTATVVADTGAGASIHYPPNSGVLVPFTGDSSLLLDAGTLGVVLLDPQARMIRVAALPKPSDAFTIVAMTGVAVIDPKGRLIYRGVQPPSTPQMSASGAATPPPAADSAPIVRGDFETRRIDTLGMIAIPSMRARTTEVRGRMTRVPIMNPLPPSDNWAVTSDGSLAIVRSRDYHIDWVRPDGTKISTPKMPFDWRKLSEDDKARVLDSALKAREKFFVDRGMAVPTMEMVSASELPDYYPPIFQNTVRADRDNHLWIPPSTSLAAQPGSALYDVVDIEGRILKRVRISDGRALVGFGRNGAVYLAAADSAGTHLMRARLP